MSSTLPRPPYLRLTLFTLALAMVIQGVKYYQPQWVYPNVFFILAFFMFIFLLSYFVIQLSFSQINPKKSVTLHLTAVIVRLILCVFSAFIFLKIDPEYSGLFVTNFLMVYLFYLGFEIYSLLSNLRPDLKP